MNGLSNTWLMGSIMVAAGFGIPVMASLNSSLGARLGHPVMAATILFALALGATVAVLVLQERPLAVRALAVPPQFYLGGVFVAFYVLSITWIAPKIGVGNAIFLVLLGQLVASGIVDHYGWFGAPKAPMTTARSLGIVLMIAGIFLARLPIGES